MLKEAEITGQQSIPPLSENEIERAIFSSGRVNFFHSGIIPVRTGEDTRLKLHGRSRLPRDLLPYRFLARTTGAELPVCFNLALYLMHDIASDEVLTGYDATFSIQRLRQVAWPESRPELPSAHASIAVEIERLRGISGLTIEQLTEVFKVSRTTYHHWMKGMSPRSAHREQVLEVLALIEEAAQRVDSPGAMSNWLLTPLPSEGKKPIDYLKEQQYMIFRGLALHRKTGYERFQPIAPQKRVHSERSPEELEDRREQLRPRAWRDRE